MLAVLEELFCRCGPVRQFNSAVIVGATEPFRLRRGPDFREIVLGGSAGPRCKVQVYYFEVLVVSILFIIIILVIILYEVIIITSKYNKISKHFEEHRNLLKGERQRNSNRRDTRNKRCNVNSENLIDIEMMMMLSLSEKTQLPH